MDLGECLKRRAQRQAPGSSELNAQHHRAGAVQLIFERVDNRRMVVARVVDAIARKKVDDAPAIGSEQLSSHASFIGDIHPEQAKQLDPLGIHIVGVSICRDDISDWHHEMVLKFREREGSPRLRLTGKIL
jgi:hypothetical protein